MSSIAVALAAWSSSLTPSVDDIALAERSLRDTTAVVLSAADEPLVAWASCLGEAGQWAVAAHLHDFDDLHLGSTAHISAVILPVVAACGGGPDAYLAGAGVMARIGNALAWDHYLSGWHSTCTAGALAAAVAASRALDLDSDATAHSIALAIPAAGGVQQAFGTDAKSLQVGFAADAGVRAALLARSGATADLDALEQWIGLVAPRAEPINLDGPAVPGGLALKLFPCCYAMQRPIAVVRQGLAGVPSDQIQRLVVRTPAGTVHPLIHPRPTTGLQAKFSLEYAIATALVDGFPTREAFSDDAVLRPELQRLVSCVEVDLQPDDGEGGLLAGEIHVTAHLRDGSVRTTSISTPPGSPQYPPTLDQLSQKIMGCGPAVCEDVRTVSWLTVGSLLRTRIERKRADTLATVTLS